MKNGRTDVLQNYCIDYCVMPSLRRTRNTSIPLLVRILHHSDSLSKSLFISVCGRFLFLRSSLSFSSSSSSSSSSSFSGHRCRCVQEMMVVQSRNHEEDEQGGGELVFMSQIKQDSLHQEKKPKPLPDGKSLKCPRCESVNTKFCYYNNYSLSQPRYFCKGCRRYWTQGGSLRNVPVGGGCRKNKRCSPSSSTTTASTTTTTCTTLVAAAAAAAAANACHNNNAGQFLHQHQLTYEYDPSDLSLAFGRLHAPINPPPLVSLSTTPHYESGPFVIDSNCNSGQIIHHSPEVPGFLDILRGGFFDANPIAASGHTNFFYGLGGNLEGEEENLPFFPIGGEISNESPQMMKHESPCKSDDGGSFGDRRVDGVQQNWQVGGVDGTTNMMMAGLDSGRDYYWSSGGVGGGGVWHGLVNSSLM